MFLFSEATGKASPSDIPQEVKETGRSTGLPAPLRVISDSADNQCLQTD